MPATPEDLFALLDQWGISVQTHHHEPAHTVEQGQAVWGAVPGVHCKNLFLKDAKGKLWLVVAPIHRRIDLKSLPRRIGSARLSFGSAELLERVLGVAPGSVTPFALINDHDNAANLVLDDWMVKQELLNFHPLRNHMTTTITAPDFLRFLDKSGRRPIIASLEEPA